MLIGINPKAEWGIYDKDFCDEEGNRRVGYNAETLAPFLVSKYAILWIYKAHRKCWTNEFGNVATSNVQYRRNAKGKYDVDGEFADPPKRGTHKYKN